MDSEWDDEKDKINRKKHGISFEFAQYVFEDPRHIVFPDPHEEEDRYRILGMVDIHLLFVVFVEKNHDTIRIVSARKATKHERNLYETEL